MRGVYLDIGSMTRIGEGSSPHARGLPGHDPPLCEIGRIIPACAGFTRRSFCRRGARQDHPRMRGVYIRRDVVIVARAGSSPHARGLQNIPVHSDLVNRIIPACAGFTSGLNDELIEKEDHPRMRGVYSPFAANFAISRGSSPHARGLLFSSIRNIINIWIIPACAGFTFGQWMGTLNFPDHPRMRGVYRLWFLWTSSSKGSSPHARGLLGQVWEEKIASGIIPACAGFTHS